MNSSGESRPNGTLIAKFLAAAPLASIAFAAWIAPLCSFAMVMKDVSPASRSELRAFLRALPAEFHNKPWYGEVVDQEKVEALRCGYGIQGKDGKPHQEGLSLYVVDINNDGIPDYVLTARCGGSLATDTILEVFEKKSESFAPLAYSQALASNGLSRNQFPMRFRSPFLSVRDGLTVMQFQSPEEDWIWKKDRFLPVGTVSGDLRKP